MRLRKIVLSISLFWALLACVACTTPKSTRERPPKNTEKVNSEPSLPDQAKIDSTKKANVTKVVASGSSGQYMFSVTLKSPDTGCALFADWWEVLDKDGKLLYRRVLLHSHVDEQPFTRSGGSININDSQVVFVRGHMNKGGYGGIVFKGSVKSGFAKFDVKTGFAADVASQQPLPTSCAF